MRRLLALALALVLALPIAGTGQVQSLAANFTYRYDVDSATLTYCRLEGANNDPYAGSRLGQGTIKTTGSSTSVTTGVAAAGPFIDSAVGDVLSVLRQSASGSPTDNVVITVRTDDNNVTVDQAVDWSAVAPATGFSWRTWKLRCGTTDNDGWIDVGGARTALLTVQYDQGDLDALRVRFECKGYGLGAAPVIVYPGEASDCGLGGTLSTDRCSFATAGATARLSIVVDPNHFGACRIGLAFAATDTSDAGANLERVTASVTKQLQ